MLFQDRLHNQAPACQLSLMQQAAASSLVSATLLRCLLQDSVCTKLGSSQAYKLASCTTVALESGIWAAHSLADLSAMRLRASWPSPLLPQAKWLAEVLCTCMTAVQCTLQLLQQQAGSQLHQALLRTVCTADRLAEFWWTSVQALAEIDQASGESWVVYHACVTYDTVRTPQALLALAQLG